VAPSLVKPFKLILRGKGGYFVQVKLIVVSYVERGFNLLFREIVLRSGKGKDSFLLFIARTTWTTGASITHRKLRHLGD
jgi:hypothetical protein